MHKQSFLIRGIIIIFIATALVACARGKQFDIKERQDALHHGQYPNFSIKPKAATTQFTNQESQTLVNDLAKNAQGARTIGDSYQTTTNNLSLNQKDAAKREIEDTIRQIEKSSRQN